jgi:alpha-L-arabinofuranosidase
MRISVYQDRIFQFARNRGEVCAHQKVVQGQYFGRLRQNNAKAGPFHQAHLAVGDEKRGNHQKVMAKPSSSERKTQLRL